MQKPAEDTGDEGGQTRTKEPNINKTGTFVGGGKHKDLQIQRPGEDDEVSQGD